MKKECQSCGGTGQIRFFQGVSRFLLTEEECPECAGLGYVVADNEKDPQELEDNPENRSERKK